MTTPITVFVCYKKKLSKGQENEKAGILHAILKEDGRFEPWMDDSGLDAGIAWETEIYRRILVSDVLLVLVGPGTSQSDWVRREIALATALGVAIVPLGFDLSPGQMNKELKALDIAHLQYKISQNIKLNAREALLVELRANLQAACLRTKEQQKETLRDLTARRAPVPPKAAEFKQKAATFTLRAGGQSIPLHIATGDMFKVRDIDVLVNSENNYMQMARFFESKTVSSMLRRRGGCIRREKYEDTIQEELDWQLRGRGRPVDFAEVLATSAGGPDSELVKSNKARYVFHVAAVEAVAAEAQVIPFKQPYQIEECARGVLSKFKDVNHAQGVISPLDTVQRKEQELRRDQGHGVSHSVLFPLSAQVREEALQLRLWAPCWMGSLGSWTIPTMAQSPRI